MAEQIWFLHAGHPMLRDVLGFVNNCYDVRVAGKDYKIHQKKAYATQAELLDAVKGAIDHVNEMAAL